MKIRKTQLSTRCFVGLLTVVVGATVAWSQQRNRPPVVTSPPSAATVAENVPVAIGSGVAATEQYKNSTPAMATDLPRPSAAVAVPPRTNASPASVSSAQQSSLPVGTGMPQPSGTRQTYAKSRPSAMTQQSPHAAMPRSAVMNGQEVAPQKKPQRRKAPSARGGSFHTRRSPGLIQHDPSQNAPDLLSAASADSKTAFPIPQRRPIPEGVATSPTPRGTTPQVGRGLPPQSAQELPMPNAGHPPQGKTRVATASAMATPTEVRSGTPGHLIDTMQQLQATYRQQAMLLSRLVPHVQPGQRADLQKAIKRAQASRAKLATQLGRMRGGSQQIDGQSPMTAGPVAVASGEGAGFVRTATEKSEPLTTAVAPVKKLVKKKTAAEPPQPPQALVPMPQGYARRANPGDAELESSADDFFGRAE